MQEVRAAELTSTLARAATPVAVVFARRGFAPSDALVEALSAIESELGARVSVLRLELDDAPALVAELRVHKVPELLVWAAGGRKLLARMEGAMKPAEVLDLLEVAVTRA